jgi:hypothetical protein
VWLQRRRREGRPVQRYSRTKGRSLSASLGVCACGSVRTRGMKTSLKHRGADRGPDVIDHPWHMRMHGSVCVAEDQLMWYRPSLALGREAGGPRVTSTHHCTPSQPVRRGDNHLDKYSLPLE